MGGRNPRVSAVGGINAKQRDACEEDGEGWKFFGGGFRTNDDDDEFEPRCGRGEFERVKILNGRSVLVSRRRNVIGHARVGTSSFAIWWRLFIPGTCSQ